jgi:hypothetical protein
VAYKDEVFRFSPLLHYQLADTAGAYATEVSGDSPVAYWRLEETTGSTANDETSNNHDLTLYNTPTLDVDGISEGSNGMTFTGSSSEYGSVADHANFAWGTACTFEGWIKTTSTATNQPIVSQWNSDYAFWLGFESAGQATLRVRIASTNYTAQVSGGWNDGAWHHLVGVRDGTEIRLYVDGKIVARTTVASGSIDSSTSNVDIGRVAGTAYVTATLDEIALYTKVLTPAEILSHYLASSVAVEDVMNTAGGSFNGFPTLGQTGPFTGATAVAFDGTDDYLSGAVTLDTASDFTVAGWVNIDQLNASRQPFSIADLANNNYRFGLEITSTGTLKPYYYTTGGTKTSATASTATISASTWYYVALVKSGSTLLSYVNGVEYTSTAMSSQRTWSASTTLNAGSGVAGGSTSREEFWDGKLSEVSLFGSALTANQLAWLYWVGQKASSPVSYYHHLVLSTRPTLYYRLGEASGTTADDEMGVQDGTYVNTPTLSASSLVAADTDNKAVTFASASSEYVEVNDNAALDASAYSLEAWITTSTTGSGVYQAIMSRDISSGLRHFQFRISNNVLEFIAFNTSSGATTLTTTHAPCDGKSHHVVATLSGTSMTVYMDGVAQTGTLSGTAQTGGTLSMLIGANRNNVDAKEHFFNGTIDDAAFYNRALTAAEVDEHFIVGSQVRRWDPDDKASPVTLSDRGHKASHTAATWDGVRAERPLNNGKFYWEVTITDTSNGGTGGSASLVVGVASPEHGLANTNPGYASGVLGWSDNSKESVGWTAWGSQAWADGAIVGVYMDTEAGDIGFTYNGTDKGTMYTGKSVLTAWFPFVALYGTAAVTVNLGDSAFTYTPPSGYAAPARGPTPVVATKKHMSRVHSDYWVYDSGLSLYKKGGSSSYRGAQGVGPARSTGKYYFEYHSIDADTTAVGITKAGESLTAAPTTVGTGDAYAYWNNNGNKTNGDGTSGAAYGATWNRHKIGVAVDFDAGKIWFAKDNAWQASGDPAAGTNAAYATLAGAFLPTVNSGGLAGQYGYFVFDEASLAYTPPSGFSPWGDVSTITLAVADALHALTSGDPLEPVVIELLVADALHALASLNVSMDVPLVLANALHDLLSDSATFDIPLATAWGTHGHSAAIMVLDQLHNLLVRAATHAHSATSSGFFQAHLLATQNTGHAISDDVTLDMPLAIDGAGHSSGSSSPAWSQVHVLTGMGGWHRVSSDTLMLPPGLIPDNAAHGHSAGNITLLEAVFIQAASAVHAQLAQVGGFVPELVVANGQHAVDSTGAVQVWLVAQDAGHAHSTESAVLSQLHQLLVASALHAESAGAVSFGQAHSLVVQNGGHGVTSDASVRAKQINTKSSRVYVVPPNDRTHVVPPQPDRDLDVPGENRRNVVS